MQRTLIAFFALSCLFVTSRAAACHSLGTWQRLAGTMKSLNRVSLLRLDAPTKVTEASCTQVGSTLHTLIGYDEYTGGNLRASDEHWVLDLNTGSWAQRAAVPFSGSHAQATSNGSHVFVAGGLLGDYPGDLRANVVVYSIADDTWSEMTPLPRVGASAGFTYDAGKLYYFSGLFDINNSSADSFIFDFANPTVGWQPLATAFPDPRNHFMAIRVRANLFVMPGGQHHNIDPLPIDIGTVYGFNPATGQFGALPDMPAPRSHSDSVVSNGRLIVLGGRNNQADKQIHNDIIEYSPEDNAWFSLGLMPQQRLSPCIAVNVNASGTYLFMTKGGIDWNIEVAETWVSKLEVLCNFTDLMLEADTTTSSVGSTATSAASSVASTATSGGTSVATTATSGASSVATTATSGASSIATTVTSGATSIGDDVTTGFTTGASTVTSVATSLVSAVTGVDNSASAISVSVATAILSLLLMAQ